MNRTRKKRARKIVKKLTPDAFKAEERRVGQRLVSAFLLLSEGYSVYNDDEFRRIAVIREDLREIATRLDRTAFWVKRACD